MRTSELVQWNTGPIPESTGLKDGEVLCHPGDLAPSGPPVGIAPTASERATAFLFFIQTRSPVPGLGTSVRCAQQTDGNEQLAAMANRPCG